MKYLYTIILISIVIVSGCSNNEAEKDLIKENEQLNKEIAKLESSKEELELDLKIVTAESKRKNDLLNTEISSLQVENERRKGTIDRYQKTLEFAPSNTSSIFSPEKVINGNQVAGLVVSIAGMEMVNETTGYYVNFTGDFEVKGSIVHNVIGGSEYTFIVEENLERMPHTIGQFEAGSIFFDIENTEELKKVVGDKLENLSENDQLEIVGVFKNYSFNYVPETDFPSDAEFVRLKSEK